MVSGKPAQVFIVEDNDPDVFLVEEALRFQGMAAQIQRSRDGEEPNLPRIIIIDLNLPKVTGLEILKHVRSPKQLLPNPKTDRALSLQLGADA